VGKADAVTAIGIMAAGTGIQLPQDRVEFYVDALTPIAPAVLLEAAKILARGRWFPPLGEVEDKCLELVGALPPTAEELAAIVRKADVREAITRRDGSVAYHERFWRWPEMTRAAKEAIDRTLAVVGEPADQNDRDHFGWHQDFKKIAEKKRLEVRDEEVKALPMAQLPPGGVQLLPPTAPARQYDLDPEPATESDLEPIGASSLAFLALVDENRRREGKPPMRRRPDGTPIPTSELPPDPEPPGDAWEAPESPFSTHVNAVTGPPTAKYEGSWDGRDTYPDTDTPPPPE